MVQGREGREYAEIGGKETRRMKEMIEVKGRETDGGVV